MALFLKTIRVNEKYKIIFIIQMIMVVLFIKGEVFDLWEQKNINESIRYDSDMYYVSNCINESQHANTLMKKCKRIQEEYGIEVGYELQGNAKLNGEHVTVIYVNDTMEKIQYNLKHGMWFEGEDKQQFILGYDWNGKYKIGDIIKITLSTGAQVKGKVQGILTKDSVFAKLNSGGQQMDYQLMLEEIDNNCIITNSKEVSKSLMGKVSIISLIAKGNEQDVKKAFSDYDITSFEEIRRNSGNEMKEKLSTSGIYILMFGVLIINSFILISAMVYHLNLELYRVYYALGMSKKKIFTLCMLDMLLQCIVAFGIIFIIEILCNSGNNGEVQKMLYAKSRYMIIGVLFAIIMVLQGIYTILMLHKIKEEK